MTPIPSCRPVIALTFAGHRSRPFVTRVFPALAEGRSGRGSGPSRLECLLLAGQYRY
jgi:hypothetical protein